MNFETDAGIFWTRAHRTEPSTKITLCSGSRDTLLSIMASIELAGVEAEADFDDLFIRTPAGGAHELDLDRVTLVLWFEFETLNYLHVGEYNV